jgi:AcrR family transcriptional regulator
MGTRGSSLALTFAFVVLFSPAVRADDASAYRGFRLGMTVLAVATEAGISPTAVKVVFERPLLIQELEWRPADGGTTGAPGERDTVAQVLFGFCNGELYRIVVSYDPDRTEGLTEQDLVEALSAAYGPARTPIARIITSPASQTYSDTEPVTARWEDARSSVNLFHRSYRSTFGLVIFSKTLAPVARAGIETALRLAELDAPRREIAKQQARDEIERVAHAKARVANKAAFRF